MSISARPACYVDQLLLKALEVSALLLVPHHKEYSGAEADNSKCATFSLCSLRMLVPPRALLLAAAPHQHHQVSDLKQ